MPIPLGVHEFNKDETVKLDGEPHVLGTSVVWQDLNDGKYKRYVMDKGALVLQEWDGTEFKT